MAAKKAKADPREKALELMMQAVRKIGGKDAAVLLREGGRSQVKEVVATGIEVLDRYALGCGGLPSGRMIEVYGDEGAGKTAFALQCLAKTTQAGGVAIYGDTEHSFDEERARLYGVDTDRLLLIQPNSLEEAVDDFKAAITSIPAGIGPNLLVWDSIAATPVQAELAGAAGDRVVGDRARLINAMCRTHPALALKHRLCLLYVNQIREKIGVMFGDNTTTPGGRAVKFHASLRIRLYSGKSAKDEGNEHTGKNVTFSIVKNRFAPPFRKAVVPLVYAKGWDSEEATILRAKLLKLAKKNSSGRWPPQAELVGQCREALEASGWTLGAVDAPTVEDLEDAEGNDVEAGAE